MVQHAEIESGPVLEARQKQAEFIEELLAEAGEMATMPEVTVRIIDIVENPNSNLQDLHDVIRNDPVLSVRILRVVNSALYCLPSQVANVDRAIVLLGLSAVKNIAIATSMTHLFTGASEIAGFSAHDVWRHSLGIGVGAKLLFAERKRPAGDEAFLAGLISDLGILIERETLMDELTEVVDRYFTEGGDFCAIEEDVIGVDHQRIGHALAAKWRFPEAIARVIGFHHDPMKVSAEDRELPLTIHLADILASRLGVGFCPYAPDHAIPKWALEQLNLSELQISNVLEQMPEQLASAEKIFEA